MAETAQSLLRRAMPKVAGGNLKLRLKVLAAGFVHRRALAGMAQTTSPALGQIAQTRPEVLVGPLVWPYLCAAWDAPTRLKQLQEHYQILDRLGAPFPFSPEERLVLADLDDTYPGLRIVLDQPRWFIREGGLTLNLFVDDFRAYSLAFSFGERPDGQGIDCYIGALQGRNDDEAANLYRDLTKAAHGLRPRDLLIEICRMICQHYGVVALYGVRDSERHHRHPFFKNKKIAPQDYDAIWEDRGGELTSRHFYLLPVVAERRDIGEIKPNKKSLYRRRYRFLDDLDIQIRQDMCHAKPQRFPDR